MQTKARFHTVSGTRGLAAVLVGLLVSLCRGAVVSFVAGRNSSVLRVIRSAADGPGTVVLSRALPLASVCGCRLRCEAQVRAAGVSQPPNVWNGIKVMLHTDSPTEGRQWRQQHRVFGTLDWRTIRFTAAVPPNATLAQLTLGLENVTGEADFDDVRAVVLRGPPDATAMVTSTGAAFKGHDLTRLRGAMVSPDLAPESLEVLGARWKANVMRWQLIRYVAPGGETPLADYDAWLEGELRKLDRLLPQCARLGLRVVIEFQRSHHVNIYIGEFGAIRWAPGAVEYLRDCIGLFDENGWDWTYRAFREYDGWSVEHGNQREDTRPASESTDRQQLLFMWFARNAR